MAAVRKVPPTRPSTAALLEFFYPIHYKLGMALEDALRGGRLSRKQVAILWLIRSEGGPAHRMPRKEIERLLSTWYEVSSSAITKALRAMARPPLCFVEIVEDPDSGREKQVFLTPEGERFLQTMVAAGEHFLGELVRDFSSRTITSGVDFLSQLTVALDRAHPETAVQTKSKRPART